MNKNDKELIYDLLKKADANVNGFLGEGFKGEVVFEDSVKMEAAGGPSSPSRASGTTTVSNVIDNAKTGVGEALEPPLKEGLTLSDLYSKITRCTKCQLARTRNNVVPGEGVENPDVLVIGEGPGYDEDMSGRPFVGKAGVLLDKMLAAIQLDRNKNCYIANIVKCRPPNNRDPEPEEQSTCFAFLQAQIHILKPKMILCMGRIAGHKMLDTQDALNKLRGQIFDYNGIPLMVTYHPSALLRDQSLKAPAWQDLKQFKAKLDEIRSK
ncbi:MAG: uracil-DNA glycosylase [Treponema sp.]|nr:uracil-DNA glycosylase [Treponema sp.]